jgi:hypothetical protein
VGVDAFQDAFGISPRICVIVWRRCRLEQVVPGIVVNHFFGACFFEDLFNANYFESNDGQASEGYLGLGCGTS